MENAHPTLTQRIKELEARNLRLQAAAEIRQRHVDHIIECEGCGNDDDCDEGLWIGARETQLRHQALGRGCCAHLDDFKEVGEVIRLPLPYCNTCEPGVAGQMQRTCIHEEATQ